MKCRSFAERWVGWVMTYVNSMSYSIKVDGKIAGHLKPFRGIRQGGPLSPYLFIMAADVLSEIISRAVSLGQLSRVKMAKNVQ